PEKWGADTAGSGVFDPHAPGEPGDYPLPPRGGPAFQAGSAARPIPMADLLPLRQSSLALVPTLSPLAQPRERIEASVPLSQRTWGADNGVVDLNTFLDLNTAQRVTQNTGGEEQDSSRLATGARSAALADRDAPAEGVFPDRDTEKSEARSSPEQDPAGLPPAGQGDEVLALAASPGPRESVGEPGKSTEPMETRPGGRGTDAAKLPFPA